MQIDPKNGSRIPPIVPAPTERTDRSAADPLRSAADATSFAPTSALVGLLTRLQGIPDVRDDVVRQALERHAKGDLLSHAAAADTAVAILGAETHG